ncbi:stage II sporulation protein R [Sediminibacillus dalangtanensis]|uniref:Stage II sporulation protein R n=1 Tax=Sediminibacillus dalangtanensis TaxID=2729421 RepID=A0ABX7VVG1_9BACI|nr:stage II sporulation protein R [Sediminibacillus dalangtanensis]QTN00875.1 stage II sporulation protein R [Sediminibacillus dalangtanensis]
MRNYFIYFLIFLALIGFFPTKGLGQLGQTDASGYQVIPDEAIRLRILANSNSDRDQALKRLIRDRVNADITKWVRDISDIEEARELIQDKLPEIEATVQQVLEEEDSDQTYQVEYGSNVTFPDKVYGSYVYPAGEYEAILITLGAGKGANWWCVLFPPLCFLDFADGSTVAEAEEEPQEDSGKSEPEEEKEVKVKFFFLDWFS